MEFGFLYRFRVYTTLIVAGFVYKSLVDARSMQFFYPFGSEHGDSFVENLDDGCSEEIILVPRLLFHRREQSTLFINSNGVISFGTSLRTYDGTDLREQANTTMIAPYWADVNTRSGGKVWYRISANSDICFKASKHIRRGFYGYPNFKARWVLTATWYKVAYYGQRSRYKDKGNTFQVILATDGDLSFVMFHYGTLEWTTGMLNGGDRYGLGGVPAQAGLLDDAVSYTLPFSRTADVLKLVSSSNVGSPGRWMFHVSGDLRDADNHKCLTEGLVHFFPSYASLRGGHQITPWEACLWPEIGFRCLFNNSNQGVGIFKGAESPYCTTPPFSTTGLVTVRLSIDAGKTFPFYGNLEVVSRRDFFKRNFNDRNKPRPGIIPGKGGDNNSNNQQNGNNGGQQDGSNNGGQQGGNNNNNSDQQGGNNNNTGQQGGNNNNGGQQGGNNNNNGGQQGGNNNNGGQQGGNNINNGGQQGGNNNNNGGQQGSNNSNGGQQGGNIKNGGKGQDNSISKPGENKNRGTENKGTTTNKDKSDGKDEMKDGPLDPNVKEIVNVYTTNATKVLCPEFNLEHGTLYETEHENIYRVKCDNGYHKYGADVVVCTKEGLLDAPLPSCVQVPDTPPFTQLALMAWILIPVGIVLLTILTASACYLWKSKKKKKCKAKWTHTNAMKAKEVTV